MLIFLYGQDTFRSREGLRQMMEKFKKDRDPQGLNVSVVDAQKEDESRVWQEVLAIPFLAERRMVVIENLLTSKQTKLMTGLLEKIEEKTLPESNVIVFWESAEKFRSKAAKSLCERLTKERFAQKYELLKGVQLRAWVSDKIKQKGGQISRQALEDVCVGTEGNSWQQNTLIDQLITLKMIDAKRVDQIEVEDVSLFLAKKVDDNIFNLVDMAISGQLQKVYAMILRQYEIGEDAQYIFAMILRQIRILLEIKDVLEREGDRVRANLAERLGLHPFVIKKSLQMVDKYSIKHLSQIYFELLSYDKGVKTGKVHAELGLDILVSRLKKD